MAKAFASIDTDGGGTLSLQEVTAAMVKMKMKISPPDLARTFARMDADHSGELDLDEFKHLVKSLEVGPVEPTLRDRRSEAAVRLLQKRHLCSGSGFDLRFDTSTMRGRCRTEARAAHRARWAKQTEDWGGLPARCACLGIHTRWQQRSFCNSFAQNMQHQPA